jgi:DNA polymerase gamma 1
MCTLSLFLTCESKVRRNELGVQLLSRKLHTQLFPNVKSHSIDPKFIRVAQDHLRAHGLDPAQAQVLPSISFDLPPLQGRNLDEHFHRIGLHAAQPWLQLAKDFTNSELPPRPEFWDIQSGWTKYHYRPNGASFSEHVPYPNHSGNGEEILAFDVETMPAHSPFAVMACAASKNAWYAWISPWLLGESEDLQHLIPLGDPTQARLVVGHNVSYDRARILEEYHIKQTKTRFMDTMALHVAVKGISSHQRPAWMKHRKSKAKEKERKEEAAEVVVEYIQDVERQQDNESDAAKSQALKRLRLDMEESLPQLLAVDFPDVEAEITSKRWEDITSANSLADLASLYCGTELDKEIRNDFMTHTPADIRENVSDYLTYCAQDVFMTHAVFARVLPDFLKACPHPVSFAGILTMGSSFLTTDRSWERYLENAERTYRDMEEKVKTRLLQLAEEARGMMESGKWKEDVWLSQLDWTPKRAGKSRGVEPEVSFGVTIHIV